MWGKYQHKPNSITDLNAKAEEETLLKINTTLRLMTLDYSQAAFLKY